MYIALTTMEGRTIAPRTTVASSFKARLMGLLGRDDLNDDEALLLTPGGSIHTLWMRFPIDVAFLDRDLRVLRVAHRVQPWHCVVAPLRTRHVLELPAGSALTRGLIAGTMLRQFSSA